MWSTMTSILVSMLSDDFEQAITWKRVWFIYFSSGKYILQNPAVDHHYHERLPTNNNILNLYNSTHTFIVQFCTTKETKATYCSFLHLLQMHFSFLRSHCQHQWCDIYVYLSCHINILKCICAEHLKYLKVFKLLFMCLLGYKYYLIIMK